MGLAWWNGSNWSVAGLAQQSPARVWGPQPAHAQKQTNATHLVTATMLSSAAVIFAPYTVMVLFPPLQLPTVDQLEAATPPGVPVLTVILGVTLPLIVMVACFAIALDVNSRRKPIEDVSSTATYESDDKE